MFKEDLPHIAKYKYEESGVQSLETIVLDRGELVEVYQEVCDQTRQEFRFTVPGNEAFKTWPDSLWFMEASRQLVYLSGLGPDLMALKSWADVLEEARPHMRIGEDFEVQKGINIRVDRVLGDKESTLLLVLAQE